MKLLFEVPGLEFTSINTNLYTSKNIRLLVARLDRIHPVVSGNKLFKLHFFLEKASQTAHKTILTFGGAWSNHLLATAYACKLSGLNCIGLVRGDATGTLSYTLKEAASYGMKLKFIERTQYKEKDSDIFQKQIIDGFGDCIVIPEGGYHPLGAKGASLIMDRVRFERPTHICTAIGTATTFAGLIANRICNENIIGVPVLKNMHDIEERIVFLNKNNDPSAFTLFDEYHFGGYAKKTEELLHFMNSLYEQHHLPTDFVYTAKMMYAVTDKIKQDYFDDGSTIICLHTGGLQGNSSLPAGTLVF